MKTAKKVWLIVAGSLVFVGLALSVGAFASVGFDVHKLGTVSFTEKQSVIEEPFRNIRVEAVESDVEFVLSKDGSCKVSCVEREDVSCTVSVEDETLVVKEEKQNRFVEIGIYTQQMKTTVYLPQDTYETLSVQSASGNISIPASLSFAQVSMESTSGNVESEAAVEKKLFMRTVSGDVLAGQSSPLEVTAISTSGNVSLSSMTIRDTATIKTTSGNMNIKKTCAVNEMFCSSASGQVIFEQSDAGSLRAETISGDVSGTLLSQKLFQIQTVSGTVNVPLSQPGGGICAVNTASGDVRLSVE